jgi:hypothetical protein
MADTVVTSDIDVFLTDAAWAIHSTYHTVLKASSGAAIFDQDMLFDIPFLADLNKIGDHRQNLTDLNTNHENRSCHDWEYKVGDKELLRKDGILRKSESRYECYSWTITSVHMNGTISVQPGTKSEPGELHLISNQTKQSYMLFLMEKPPLLHNTYTLLTS